MTRRKKPINKTIVENIKLLEPPKSMDGVLEKYGDISLKNDPITGGFVFPNDLDKIQPEQKDGNLCIRFPE